ncbi:putative DNA-binding domain-containing protein [Pelistega europaea]|uniref:DUF2063 domain-containing protein n=1 Tax=Pelistega europaea TaxID=106147 RepID=A0A7Y4LAY5_9BURK|nr:putative DNA-binding domain-containing protein [Pelistega europaea]NOL50239.1 DUF2063 domain-containing protein [Pelistega europaea]
MMQPSDSAIFQKLLADSIRNINIPVSEQLDAYRLSVYRRLIHNNIRQFLELCFSDSMQFLDAIDWQQLQHKFIAEAAPQSPFFNDIPQQFLDYIHTLPAVDRPIEAILEMMDFEVGLLKAEIAITPEVSKEWDAETLLGWSPAAYLKYYQFDFISSDLTEYEQKTTHAIIWRNREDNVCYKSLDMAEWLLLQYFSEQGSSISLIHQQLYELTNKTFDQDWLNNTIEKWIIENVLVPMEK